jgi:hypothetical protein
MTFQQAWGGCSPSRTCGPKTTGAPPCRSHRDTRGGTTLCAGYWRRRPLTGSNRRVFRAGEKPKNTAMTAFTPNVSTITCPINTGVQQAKQAIVRATPRSTHEWQCGGCVQSGLRACALAPEPPTCETARHTAEQRRRSRAGDAHGEKGERKPLAENVIQPRRAR